MALRVPEVDHDLDEIAAALLDPRSDDPNYPGWNVDDLSVVCDVFETCEGLIKFVRRARALQTQAVEALLWCSGSPSFAPGGYAELGYKRMVLPLIDKLQAEDMRELAVAALKGQEF